MNIDSARGAALISVGALLVTLVVSGAAVRYVQPGYVAPLGVTGLVLCGFGVVSMFSSPAGHKVHPLVVFPVLLAAVALPGTVSATHVEFTAPATHVARGDQMTVLDVVQDQEHLVGQRVTVVGEVFPTPGEETPWTVMRLRMICCAADAIAYGVRVADPIEVEGWVSVTGTVALDPLRLTDVTVTPVPEPERPYL